MSQHSDKNFLLVLIIKYKRRSDAILTRIYNDHTIRTNLKKGSLKILTLDRCTKTVFSFNNIIYKQKDGKRLVLADIINTELKKKVVKPLMNDGTIKLYCQYVGGILHVVKSQDVSRIHKLLNGFEKNLKFAVDFFENEVPHFLDLKMSPDGISIDWHDNNFELYVNYTSFVPWTHRNA